VTQPAGHPIELSADDDLRLSRVTVFFRYFLAIPHLIVLVLFGIVAWIVWFVAWWVALFIGRVPDGMHGLLASYLRYATHVNAYFLLLANPFPPFGGGSSYAVDALIAPAARQGRLTIFFRFLLAIPALILTYVFGIVNRVIAILTWFYALVTGRMAGGMRDTSIWLLRYEIQTQGYLMLLTSTYPSLSGGPKVSS
jgi:Domain of unknown function (DUF4389)